MRKILSIAILTFRESVRTKLVAALAAVVALAVVGLPMLLKGDGTPVGIARMTLLYPLGAAFAFLAVAAPWAAAASLAADVKGRTLQLVRVKPVRMWQLWLGKWLGLLFLNSLLLAGAFAALHIRLLTTGARASDEIRIAKQLVQPVLPPLERQIAEMEANVAAASKNGLSPRERRDLRASLRRKLPYANASLRSGDEWKWVFKPSRLPAKGETIWLRLGLHSDALAQKQPIARLFLCADKAPSNQTAPCDISDFTAREQEIVLAAPATGDSQQLNLIIKNIGDEDAPHLLVQPRQGLFLLLRAGSLEANMARAYLVILSLLALLLALGLTAGAFFSLPVAIFATTCLIVSVLTSAYVMSDPDILDPETLARQPLLPRVEYYTSAAVTKTLATASATALTPAPLSHLSSSEWISPEEILHALVGNALALPAILALFSSLHLARKELPE